MDKGTRKLIQVIIIFLLIYIFFDPTFSSMIDYFGARDGLTVFRGGALLLALGLLFKLLDDKEDASKKDNKDDK
ncbi:MAG: hypothetical protein PUI85_00865 [Eubacteriales bacterium]|nr:hypothetical protein [Eubacteriales bacterium]MDY3332697.1 hypothetical protein [Gallibacter sp.]